MDRLLLLLNCKLGGFPCDVKRLHEGLDAMIRRSEPGDMLMRLDGGGAGRWYSEHDHSFIYPITINNAFCDFVAAINLFIGKG